MEAAALYGLGRAKDLPIVCLAHVTNQMAQVDGDFEKGLDGGAHDSLDLIGVLARGLIPSLPSRGELSETEQMAEEEY
jgi:hypothetical protein